MQRKSSLKMRRCRIHSDRWTAADSVPGWKVKPAVRALNQGKLIAYPTEAVWGLGCDPLNEAAVRNLLELKQRNVAKGLILVAADIEQLQGYLGDVTAEQQNRLLESWPGPVTWLCPVGRLVPGWIRGSHDRVALRVSAHPGVRALCESFGRPVVSTSANRSGQRPADVGMRVRCYFGSDVTCVVPGACFGADRPTRIKDLINGATLRD